LSWEGNEQALRAELCSRGLADRDADNVIAAAREAGIIVSELQLQELESFFAPWIWGPIAAAFMFGYQTPSFASLGDDVDFDDELHAMRETLAHSNLLAEGDGMTVALPVVTGGELAQIVGRRRSRRAFGRQPLQASQLASCLEAAFGLTGEEELDDGRTLPLTGAPSSGGLNTYDAVVLSQRVAGFEQGTYRFLPREHALARVEGGPVSFDRLFGKQGWCAGAACAIVLVADLRRQASRYAFPTTVSATLIEAGARVELLLLAAEEASLPGVVVGMSGVGSYDAQLASEAGLPCATSMTIPICAVLLGSPQASHRESSR
jgi:SagB-type dehydrogenase family enzyme